MKTITMSLMTVLLLAASSLAGDRLENDFKAIFVKHWQISKEFTLAVAEAMPADSYNFKPNPQEMSFGEMMFWLAKSNSGACARVAGTEEMAEPASKDKQTTLTPNPSWRSQFSSSRPSAYPGTPGLQIVNVPCRPRDRSQHLVHLPCEPVSKRIGTFIHCPETIERSYSDVGIDDDRGGSRSIPRNHSKLG